MASCCCYQRSGVLKAVNKPSELVTLANFVLERLSAAVFATSPSLQTNRLMKPVEAADYCPLSKHVIVSLVPKSASAV